MTETPNFGFYAVRPDDLDANLIEVMQAINGSGSTSNIMRIDALFKALQDRKQFTVVESDVVPTGLGHGDEWDYVIGSSTANTYASDEF